MQFSQYSPMNSFTQNPFQGTFQNTHQNDECQIVRNVEMLIQQICNTCQQEQCQGQNPMISRQVTEQLVQNCQQACHLVQCAVQQCQQRSQWVQNPIERQQCQQRVQNFYQLLNLVEQCKQMACQRQMIQEPFQCRQIVNQICQLSQLARQTCNQLNNTWGSPLGQTQGLFGQTSPMGSPMGPSMGFQPQGIFGQQSPVMGGHFHNIY